MTSPHWDLQVDLDDAAFAALDQEPVLTDHLADVCRDLDGAGAGPASPGAGTAEVGAALVTVLVVRVAAMGVSPDGGINLAI